MLKQLRFSRKIIGQAFVLVNLNIHIYVVRRRQKPQADKTDEQKDRQTVRQIGRKADRQRVKQIDRQSRRRDRHDLMPLSRLNLYVVFMSLYQPVACYFHE